MAITLLFSKSKASYEMRSDLYVVALGEGCITKLFLEAVFEEQCIVSKFSLDEILGTNTEPMQSETKFKVYALPKPFFFSSVKTPLFGLIVPLGRISLNFLS